MPDEVILEPVTINIEAPAIPEIDPAIVVSVVADPEPEVIQEPEPGVVATPPSDDPAEAIASLKRQLADKDAVIARERSVALEAQNRQALAERQSAENASRATESATREAASNYDSIVNALSAAETQADSLALSHEKALESGDFKAASKIQLEMGKVAARIDRLEAGKSEMDAQRGKAPVQPTTQPRGQEQPAQLDWNRAWSPTEANAFLETRTPRTAAWIKQNDKFVSDPSFRAQVAAADNLAVTKGYARDSDDYFRFVESQVSDRVSYNPKAPTQEPEPAPKPVPKPAVAAPPSRATPGQKPAAPTPTQITLTPEQRQIARSMFSDPKVNLGRNPEVMYAQQLADMIRKGEIQH